MQEIPKPDYLKRNTTVLEVLDLMVERNRVMGSSGSSQRDVVAQLVAKSLERSEEEVFWLLDGLFALAETAVADCARANGVSTKEEIDALIERHKKGREKLIASGNSKEFDSTPIWPD